MNHKQIFSIIIVLLIMIASCGGPLEYDSVDEANQELQGMSKEELLELLGEPTDSSDVTTNFANFDYWHYTSEQLQVINPNSDEPYANIQISFDDEDVVVYALFH